MNERTLMTFWMVLGSDTPKFRQPSLRSASVEAQRLAKENPGKEFTVLQAIVGFTSQEVTKSCYEDIPF